MTAVANDVEVTPDGAGACGARDAGHGMSTMWRPALGTLGVLMGVTALTGTSTMLASDAVGPDPSGRAARICADAADTAGAWRLFSTRSDSIHGPELWVGDATGESAGIVTDLRPGPRGSSIRWMVPTGEGVLFSARALRGADDLWFSDGTPEGTRLVADLNPGKGSDPQPIAVLGSTLLFAAIDPDGPGVWATDATAEGTHLVARIDASRDDEDPDDRAVPTDNVLDGRAFFAARDALGSALWVTDGTVVGTMRLPAPAPAGDLRVVGGRVVFPADDGVTGVEPWVSDGTAAGTGLLRDINPFGDSWPDPVGMVGAALLFSAEGRDRGTLWATDGTPSGTRYIAPVVPVYEDEAYGHRLMKLGSKHYLIGTDMKGRIGLWRTDGTRAGTKAIIRSTDLPRAAGWDDEDLPPVLVRAGRRLYLIGSYHLWVTDGTARGVRLLRRLPAGDNGASTGAATADTDGTLLFISADPREPDLFALWRSDGTRDGTKAVGDASYWHQFVTLPGAVLSFRPYAPFALVWTPGCPEPAPS